MCKVLIFGGTTEGRILAEFCVKKEIPAMVSVFSDYGREVLEPGPFLSIREGALDKEGILTLLREKDIRLVVDATHPYAKNISENVRIACAEAGVRLLRAGRRSAPGKGDRYFASVSEVVDYLSDKDGRIFVTIGSHELGEFKRLPGFAERVCARVLPSSGVLQSLEEMGLPGRNRLAAQGPFSEEMNELQMKECGARYLVTKESGLAGGYPEKLRAARKLGVEVLVIRRPAEPAEPVLPEILQKELLAFRRASSPGMPDTQAGEVSKREVPAKEIPVDKSAEEAGKRTWFLAGGGGGVPGLLTAEVKEAVISADAVFGSARMAKLAGTVRGNTADIYPEYLPERILSEVSRNPGWNKITVLYSGDPGFSGGAKKMAEILKDKGEMFSILPGITSVGLFAAKLQVSWEDAGLVTLHGREADISFLEDRSFRKFFILAGGRDGTGELLRLLCQKGYGSWQAFAGEDLSMPQERITGGSVKELSSREYSSLSLVYLIKPGSPSDEKGEEKA